MKDKIQPLYELLAKFRRDEPFSEEEKQSYKDKIEKLHKDGIISNRLFKYAISEIDDN